MLKKSRAAKITKDSNHPCNRLFFYCHLASASGAWWQKLRDLGGASSLRPSKLKLSQITSTWLNLINSKIPTILHHCCYVYLLHIPAYSIILLFIKSTVYCSAHFILLHILFFLIFFTYIYVYSLVLCYIFCTVHWADLTWFTFHYWLYSVKLSMWRIKPWTLKCFQHKKCFLSTNAAHYNDFRRIM